MVLGVVPASGRAVAAICELPVTSRHWGYAGLGLLAAGFVLGQHIAPTDYHLVSEEVLATIDLVKEIDSVQNRELRLSRAVASPGGHIGLMAGSKAKHEIWPELADWLGERSGR